MTEHDLKTAPEHFQALCDGDKTAELRKDDRNFAVGDTLEARYMAWWDGATYEERHFWYSRRLAIINSLYTGRTLRRRVTHVLRGGPWLCEGFVMLSLKEETS
jgi:hypothetical protein